MATACTGPVEDRITGLKGKVSEVEAMVSDINTDLSNLSSLLDKLKSGDYIESISEVQAGCYVLSFESKDVLVLKDGTSGKTPVIGVRYDNSSGFYCWTIQNGTASPTWLYDSFNRKISAEATVPRLRIQDAYWQVSYDDGAHWTNLFQALGEEGSSVFRNVDWSDPYSVKFTLMDGTSFQVPTMEAINQISSACDTINNNIDAYASMITSLNSSIFIQSYAEVMEGGRKIGYNITLENGSVLTIRNGQETTGNVFLDIATDPADGVQYWRVRYDGETEFSWLQNGGSRVVASNEYSQPLISFKDSLGVNYFTVSYDGGNSYELMRSRDGRPVVATASTNFNLFRSAEIGDGFITLVTLDGEEVRFMTSRSDKTLRMQASGAFKVYADSSYSFAVTVIDTIISNTKFKTFGEYNASVGMSLTALALDSCRVTGITADSIMFRADSVKYNKITKKTVYQYKSHFTVKMTMGSVLDTTKPSRVALFLNWSDRTIMKVVEFRNAAKDVAPPVDTTTKPPVDTTAKPPVDTTSKPPVDTASKPPVDTTSKPPVDSTTGGNTGGTPPVEPGKNVPPAVVSALRTMFR